jgi:formylglycine-generating enzyme required for sulfatase activity/Flp pilus assembly protein TadD
LSYSDYIKESKSVRITGNSELQIILEVNPEALNLIADEDSLKLFKISILNKSNESIQLSYPIKEPYSDYPELTSDFHWVLAHQLAVMGRMNDKLGILVQNNDSPVQTLAYNHFENARDAFKRKNYSYALEEIDKAVFGNQTSSGYNEEWRFYMLLGVIHLGFYSCEVEMIDLQKAKEAFTNAANLAQKEFPLDAANAYLALGWVNYCQNDLQDAIASTSKAIELNPKLSEAFFQKAKILMAQGQTKEALNYLSHATDQDTFYVLKAASDGDFKAHIKELNDYLSHLKKEKYQKLKNKITEDLNILKSTSMPPELNEIIAEFTKEKSLLEISKSEQKWSTFKLKPWFVSKFIEDIKIDHEAVIAVVEPYREKVVEKPGTWYRSEKFKLITKNRVVEKRKKIKYDLIVHRDTFMFFTGKVLAEYDMVLIDGGKFSMGDTNGVGRSDEKPVQSVELSSYLISSIIVTQKLWNLAMEYNPSNFEGYNLPVEHVNWYDCLEFCNKLSILAGFEPVYTINKEKPDFNNKNKNDNVRWTVSCNWKANGYRLPTEAEWEYAAKGGKNCNFYIFSGSENGNKVAWHKDNSGYKTHNVAEKIPNELGLYDMSGNVWEWCWDWYDAYKTEASKDPKGPDSGSYRVLRGGSWADSMNYQRSSGRGKESPMGRYTSIGFRIVRKV